MIDKVGSGLKDYAPFILRMGLAIVFILQGAELVPQVRNPSAMAIIKLVVTLIGGLFLLIGFMTRWAAFACGTLMLWIIIEGERFKVLTHPDYQLPFALFVMCLASWGLGGGKYSLDEKAKKKE